MTEHEAFYQRNVDDTFSSMELSLNNVAERLLVKALHDNWLNQQSSVLKPLVHALCRLRGIDSIFKLLAMEKQRMLADFEMMSHNCYNGGRAVPESHRWVIEKLDRSMIKTDEPFVHNNAVWRLGLNYYR